MQRTYNYEWCSGARAPSLRASAITITRIENNFTLLPFEQLLGEFFNSRSRSFAKKHIFPLFFPWRRSWSNICINFFAPAANYAAEHWLCRWSCPGGPLYHRRYLQHSRKITRHWHYAGDGLLTSRLSFTAAIVSFTFVNVEQILARKERVV